MLLAEAIVGLDPAGGVAPVTVTKIVERAQAAVSVSTAIAVVPWLTDDTPNEAMMEESTPYEGFSMTETVWVLVELVATVIKLVQGLDMLVGATGMADIVETTGCI